MMAPSTSPHTTSKFWATTVGAEPVELLADAAQTQRSLVVTGAALADASVADGVRVSVWLQLPDVAGTAKGGGTRLVLCNLVGGRCTFAKLDIVLDQHAVMRVTGGHAVTLHGMEMTGGDTGTMGGGRPGSSAAKAKSAKRKADEGEEAEESSVEEAPPPPRKASKADPATTPSTNAAATKLAPKQAAKETSGKAAAAAADAAKGAAKALAAKPAPAATAAKSAPPAAAAPPARKGAPAPAAGAGAALPAVLTAPFHASAAFAGSRDGYVFKRGASGVGYYKDFPPAPAAKPAAAAAPAAALLLSRGVRAEVVRPGSGRQARRGQQVSVKYAGRLEKSGKQFDAGTIAFGLGRGEVISGWDVGIEGMRVGEKRKLTIPAEAGYGRRGSPPAIPGNSTLVFDVELLRC